MKTIALISAIALSSLLFNNKADAQIRIHLGLNFGARPVVYAPARDVTEQPADYCEPTNYDGDEDYYYLPEVDAYYSVPDQCYYYNDGSEWVSAAYLPGDYSNYDWRTARRFEVRAPRPFLHDDYYRARYNGVAFNGHWNRSYNHVYVNNEYSYNHDHFRANDQKLDNFNRGGDNRQFNRAKDQHFDNRFTSNQQMEQNRNFDNRGAQDHFARNNYDRGDREHRAGRF